MRNLIFTCFLFATSPLMASTVYEVDLVNAGRSGIVSIESARSGSGRFHAMHFESRREAYGRESVSFQLRRGDDTCVRDLRIAFADGHVLTHRRFDLCAAHAEQLLRDDRGPSGAQSSS